MHDAGEEGVVCAEGVRADGDGLVGGKHNVEFNGEEVFREGGGAPVDGERWRRVQGERGERDAEELLAVGALLFLGELAEDGHALFNDGRGDGVGSVEGPGAGVGARRKRKQVQIAEGQGAEEFEGLVEFAVGFAGEADHDIGAEGERGTGGAEERVDLLRVVPGAIASVHPAEDGIGAGLEREMRMAREATTVFDEQSDEVIVPVHGLDGAESEEGQAGLFEDLADEARQRGLRLTGFGCKVASPAAEVNAGEDEFPAPGSNKAADLRKDARGGQTARGAARLRNDAEGAAVAAALLNFEIGAGLRAGMDGRLFQERMREVVVF